MPELFVGESVGAAGDATVHQPAVAQSRGHQRQIVLDRREDDRGGRLRQERRQSLPESAEVVLEIPIAPWGGARV